MKSMISLISPVCLPDLALASLTSVITLTFLNFFVDMLRFIAAFL